MTFDVTVSVDLDANFVSNLQNWAEIAKEKCKSACGSFDFICKGKCDVVYLGEKILDVFVELFNVQSFQATDRSGTFLVCIMCVRKFSHDQLCRSCICQRGRFGRCD